MNGYILYDDCYLCQIFYFKYYRRVLLQYLKNIVFNRRGQCVSITYNKIGGV